MCLSMLLSGFVLIFAEILPAADMFPPALAGASLPCISSDASDAARNNSPSGTKRTQLLGVFVGDVGEPLTASFETALGRKVDISEVFAGGSDWQYMDSSDPKTVGSVAWLLGNWPAKRKLQVSIYLLPASGKSGESTLEQAADGAFDDHYRHAAQLLAARDPNMIVRTGWEMNGDWMVWSACSDPHAYIGAFREFVKTFRSVSPHFRIDWTPNIDKQKCAPDTAYPGDAYVDIIGQDIYEVSKYYSGRTSAQVWADDYNGPYGVKWWLEFASEHHKPISIPEWGTDVNDGYFVRQMIHLIETHNIVYQSAWNLQSDPSALVNNPINYALYKAAFGATQ